jgi:nickel superoxide dismutase
MLSPSTMIRRGRQVAASTATTAATPVAARMTARLPGRPDAPAGLGKVTWYVTGSTPSPSPPSRRFDKGASQMRIADRLLATIDRFCSPGPAHAHCDLPCGIYDPAQARIEAESVKAIMEKFNESNDDVFKTRAEYIKEERAELVKHHLWVLWTDYFKPDHLAAHPQLHDLFWKATKTAGEAKKSNDVAVGERLLREIAEIDKIFWETKK